MINSRAIYLSLICIAITLVILSYFIYINHFMADGNQIGYSVKSSEDLQDLNLIYADLAYSIEKHGSYYLFISTGNADKYVYLFDKHLKENPNNIELWEKYLHLCPNWACGRSEDYRDDKYIKSMLSDSRLNDKTRFYLYDYLAKGCIHGGGPQWLSRDECISYIGKLEDKAESKCNKAEYKYWMSRVYDIYRYHLTNNGDKIEFLDADDNAIECIIESIKLCPDCIAYLPDILNITYKNHNYDLTVKIWDDYSRKYLQYCLERDNMFTYYDFFIYYIDALIKVGNIDKAKIEFDNIKNYDHVSSAYKSKLENIDNFIEKQLQEK